MERVSFRQLLDSLPSPHMILDRELNFVAVNPAYEAATMRSSGELVGRFVFDAFPNEPEIETRLRASIENVLHSGEPDTIAYIHYRIARPQEMGGGFEDRFWTAVHTPLKDASGDVILVLQNTVDITELVRLREQAAVPFRILPGEVELVQRAQEAEEANEIARVERPEFGRMFERAPSMIAVLQGPSHIFTFANEAYRRFFRHREFVGQSVDETIPEAREQGFVALLDNVFQSGQPYVGASNRILLRGADGAVLDERFIDFSYHPIRDATEQVTGIFVQCTDRTESVRFEQRRRLLIDELNHRVKNTLSSVQSMARQTFKVDADPVMARTAFEARIQALSKTHDALSERHWEAVDLRTIALQELALTEPDRVTADGTLVRLTPKAAIALAMVLHELASNAVKYGSLSTERGTVAVRWTRGTQPDDPIVLEWVETSSDFANGTLKRGFGIRMLERIVEGELESKLALAFGASGLICRIELQPSEVERVVHVE